MTSFERSNIHDNGVSIREGRYRKYYGNIEIKTRINFKKRGKETDNGNYFVSELDHIRSNIF